MSLAVPHLISVLAEVVHGAVGVHTINSISLGFMFTESLQHILNFPKFSLKMGVLLAGRVHLIVKRKHKRFKGTANISYNETLGESGAVQMRLKDVCLALSLILTGMYVREGHLRE